MTDHDPHADHDTRGDHDRHGDRGLPAASPAPEAPQPAADGDSVPVPASSASPSAASLVVPGVASSPVRPAPVVFGERRRALTHAELDRVRTRIEATSSTPELLTVVLVEVYRALLHLTPEEVPAVLAGGLDPTRFAIPATQWAAIVSWATNRATQWGTTFDLGLRLATSMPSSYDDPTAVIDSAPPVDHRPATHTVTLSRQAVDTITACTRHVAQLAAAYGDTSPRHVRAATTWLHHLTALLDPALGATTHIHRDGPRSLHVRTASGLDYGVIFHPDRRHCTTDGCHALIADDATITAPHPTAQVLDHDHTPSHPLNGPTPGAWTHHS